MKKYFIVAIIITIILIISIVGSILVTPKNEIDKIKDKLAYQIKKDSEFSCYSYTINNPKIIIDPYSTAPLSALIMFKTDTEEKITIQIKKKDETLKTLYQEKKETKEHYLDIYELYANYENTIILKYADKRVEYKIKTKLDNIKDIDLENIEVQKDKIYFMNKDNDILGINDEKEIVYYFKDYNNPNIHQLLNNHLLLSSSRINNDNKSTGLVEIDALGKIYNEYIIKDGYFGIVYIKEDGNYLLLSKNLIEIDRQNGKTIKEFKIDDIDEWINIEYNKLDNTVSLIGKNKTVIYDYDKKNKIDVIDKENSYINDNNLTINKDNLYNKNKQNRFGSIDKTTTSKENVNLLSYKKVDDEYKKYNINIKEEFDRLVITKDIDEDIYLILDKFGGKKIYKVDKNNYFVSKTTLKGKYSIYVKINKTVYKTNYYVNI